MGLFQTTVVNNKSTLMKQGKAPKVRMMSIHNNNHFISGSLVSEIFNSGQKNKGTKLQQYNNYAAVNIND